MNFFYFQGSRLGSSVVWSYSSLSPHPDLVQLNAADRAGVRISTWREDEGQLLSILEMVNLGAQDGGNYICSVPYGSSMAFSPSVRLHVVTDTPEPVLNNTPGTLFSTVIFTSLTLLSILIPYTVESRCILARGLI